jgi:hypothetical protein
MDKAKHGNRTNYALVILILVLIGLTWFIGLRYPVPLWFTPPHHGWTPFLYIAFSFAWIPATYLLLKRLHWQPQAILLALLGGLSSLCYIGWWIFVTFLITDTLSYSFMDCTFPSEAEIVCTHPYIGGEYIYHLKVLSPAVPLMVLQSQELIWEEIPRTETQGNEQNK